MLALEALVMDGLGLKENRSGSLSEEVPYAHGPANPELYLQGHMCWDLSNGHRFLMDYLSFFLNCCVNE